MGILELICSVKAIIALHVKTTNSWCGTVKGWRPFQNLIGKTLLLFLGLLVTIVPVPQLGVIPKEIP
jgi:hypothetical protein